jgi:hypothetical protein
MADAPTTWQVVGGVGGLATVCGGIWGGIKWLFGRAERKEAALDAKEAQLVAKLEARIVALEERDERREAEFLALRTELQDTRAALIIVAQEVAMTNPTSPALALARTLLRERFPLDPHTPSDMTETLKKI